MEGPGEDVDPGSKVGPILWLWLSTVTTLQTLPDDLA